MADLGHERTTRTDGPDSVNNRPMYVRYDVPRYVDYRQLFHCLEVMTADSCLDEKWCAEFATALGLRVTESRGEEQTNSRDTNFSTDGTNG
jgi:hypothetical protein